MSYRLDFGKILPEREKLKIRLKNIGLSIVNFAPWFFVCLYFGVKSGQSIIEAYLSACVAAFAFSLAMRSLDSREEFDGENPALDSDKTMLRANVRALHDLLMVGSVALFYLLPLMIYLAF